MSAAARVVSAALIAPRLLLAGSFLGMLAIWAWSRAGYGSVARADVLLLVGLRNAVVASPAALWPVRESMLGATFLGAFPTLCVVVLGAASVLALEHWRRDALLLVACSGVGIGLANLLKRVVDRPRPSVVEHWASFDSASFPSGHSADATIAYLLLATVAMRRIGPPPARRAATSTAIVLPLLVGCSRVVLGVHWPTDVLGGWCIGSAYVILCQRLGLGNEISAGRG